MATAKSTTTLTPRPFSWRTLYPVHPCADVFPMMSEADLDALAKDIEANGLQRPVELLRPQQKTGRPLVLDGRNRLEAIARLGVRFARDPEAIDVRKASGCLSVFAYVEHVDPAAYVIGANIRRRHLSKEQQAELILKTIEASQIDSATSARSFNPTSGKKGGSTKDPVLATAVTEAAKHGISKRTVQAARAKTHGKITAPRKPPRLAVHHSSKTAEHYTPQTFLDLVCEVFGDIPDLDPCSNSIDAPNVAAHQHYTAADDGLKHPWRGRVFVNPPYGDELLAWTQKLRAEWARGEITELIALLPARPGSEWWTTLIAEPDVPIVCFLDGRLRFIGNKGSAPFPSMVMYFGAHHDRFESVFVDHGSLWRRTRGCASTVGAQTNALAQPGG